MPCDQSRVTPPPAGPSPLRRLLRGGAALAAGVGLAAAAVGCAREGDEQPLPSACSSGEERIRGALAVAPGPVRVDGTALSACLDRTSDGSELQAVGSSFVAAAGRLADRATRRPEGPEATQLGYLVGAMQRGAGQANHQGVHTELVRRVELELDAVGLDSRAVTAGLRAGRRTG